MADTVLVHPNRDKPESKATRAVVMLLLITSAALILIVTIGGWSELQGMEIVSFGYAIVYLLMAYFVGKWKRALLPDAAGLAILFAVVAAVAGPAWFDRDKAGFNDPALEPSILGMLTLILVPVQLLLVAFAMRGFQHRDRGAPRRGRALRPGRPRREAADGLVVAGISPTIHPLARVLELVDNGPSKGPVLRGVWVRIPPRAYRHCAERRWHGCLRRG